VRAFVLTAGSLSATEQAARFDEAASGSNKRASRRAHSYTPYMPIGSFGSSRRKTWGKSEPAKVWRGAA
jgi:hypothetical protein